MQAPKVRPQSPNMAFTPQMYDYLRFRLHSGTKNMAAFAHDGIRSPIRRPSSEVRDTDTPLRPGPRDADLRTTAFSLAPSFKTAESAQNHERGVVVQAHWGQTVSLTNSPNPNQFHSLNKANKCIFGYNLVQSSEWNSPDKSNISPT